MLSNWKIAPWRWLVCVCVRCSWMQQAISRRRKEKLKKAKRIKTEHKKIVSLYLFSGFCSSVSFPFGFGLCFHLTFTSAHNKLRRREKKRKKTVFFLFVCFFSPHLSVDFHRGHEKRMKEMNRKRADRGSVRLIKCTRVRIYKIVAFFSISTHREIHTNNVIEMHTEINK